MQDEATKNSEEESGVPESVEEASDLAERGDVCQFLTFTVGKEEYGVDLLQIREIKGWTATTRIPNSPEFMKGVINLRGAVIPIFDLRGRFKMGETVPTDLHVVIMIAVGERLLGILVDSVSDIVEVRSDDIKQAPQIELKLDDEFVKGLISIGEKMVVILDIDRLFDPESLRTEGGLAFDFHNELDE